jgi:hypothetical protein
MVTLERWNQKKFIHQQLKGKNLTSTRGRKFPGHLAMS